MVRSTKKKPKATPKAKASAVKAQDFTAAPVDVVCQVFGVSKTTLQNWRASGAPCRKDGRSMVYDLPALVQWRRDRDVEQATAARHSAARADMDTPAEDLDDRQLAQRALRRLVLEGGDIACVQAAKAILGIAPEAEDDSAPTVVSFIEIENVDGVVQAQGVSTPCPHCGKLVQMPV